MLACYFKKLKRYRNTLRKLTFIYAILSFIELVVMEINQIAGFINFGKYKSQLLSIYKITNNEIYFNQIKACVNNMIKCGVYFIYIIACGMVLFAAITFITSFVIRKKKKSVKEEPQNTENI